MKKIVFLTALICVLLCTVVFAAAPVTVSEIDFTQLDSAQEAQTQLAEQFNMGSFNTITGSAPAWSEQSGINFVWPSFAQLTMKEVLPTYRLTFDVCASGAEWTGLGLREVPEKIDLPNDDAVDGVMGNSANGIMFALHSQGGIETLKIAFRTESMVNQVVEAPIPSANYFFTDYRRVILDDRGETITFTADDAMEIVIALSGLENGYYTQATVSWEDGEETVEGIHVPETGVCGIYTRNNNTLIKYIKLEKILDDSVVQWAGVTTAENRSVTRNNIKEQLKVKISSGQEREALLLAASYGTAGELLNVTAQKAELLAGTTEVLIPAGNAADTADNMKLFLFENGTIKPVLDAYNLELGPLYVPNLSVPWAESTRIVGPEEGYETQFWSDFLFVQDDLNRWHAIGIGSGGTNFFHAIGDKIDEPFTYTTPVYGNGEASQEDMAWMWAPYAVRTPQGTAYMYYAHYQYLYDEDGNNILDGAGNKTVTTNMRILEATDGTLETWEKVEHPDLEDGNIAFADGMDRDACILFDEETQEYWMYYAGSDLGGIVVRTSKDQIHWSEPICVLSGVPQPSNIYVGSESPFVLKKFGYYYLFVSGFDYGRVSVYASKDPFDFGDAALDRLGEINGHAPEIVTDNGKEYIGCAAISTQPNGVPAYQDIYGVFVQELAWNRYDEAEWLYGDEREKENYDVTYEGKWSFEDSLVDSISGLHEDFDTSNATFTEGVSGKGLSFTGTNSVNIGYTGASINPSAFSISIFMKQDAPTNGYGVMVAKGPKAAGHFEVYTLPQTGNISFYQWEMNAFPSEVPVCDGQWHHIVYTYDGETLKLYVDGTMRESYQTAVRPVANVEKLSFGALNDNTFNFTGSIDEFQIFDKALTDAEVAELADLLAE